MATAPTLDARVAFLATRQLGLITWDQALRLGCTRHEVQQRVKTGRWRALTRGVYAIAGHPATWQRDALAACLAGPPGAVASFVTGAALWRLANPRVLPDVTFPPSASARLPIAKVHRAQLDAKDVTKIGPIPVTRVPRTLIDFASVASSQSLERAVDTALDEGLTTANQIMVALERSQRGPGRAGVPALLHALEAWTDPIRPGSPAEARLLRHLASWGFSTPVRQHVVRD